MFLYDPFLNENDCNQSEKNIMWGKKVTIIKIQDAGYGMRDT